MIRYIVVVAVAAVLIPASRAKVRPNIIYVMTDDQDVELGGMTPMPLTRKLVGEAGAIGENFYIQTPICCPSRTETLSGRMYHNVLSDDLSGCMHVNSTGYIFQHSASLFPALQSAGYMTGGFGKIINGQQKVFAPGNDPSKAITNGWDWLSVPMDEGNYFGPKHFEKRPNGSTWISSLGDPKEVIDEWYQTSQIGNRSIEFIEAALTADKPFVAYLGPHAPHYSADSAPWARDLYSDLKAPRTPAYNTSVGQVDKTKHIAINPPLNKEAEHWIDTHFRDRWRSIKGVDDMISLIIEKLHELGILENTFVFFTSDHGFKLGEWRVGYGKQHPFESDIHIPFLARGPGIAPGTRINSLGSNIDIAPTFIDIAGLPPNPEHDGKSLLPLLLTAQDTPERLKAEKSWRTSLLIEYFSVGTIFNDHAKIYVSGPGPTPGTPRVYGRGPWSPTPNVTSKEECQHKEATATVGQAHCYFMDSKASNNWWDLCMCSYFCNGLSTPPPNLGLL